MTPTTRAMSRSGEAAGGRGRGVGVTPPPSMAHHLPTLPLSLCAPPPQKNTQRREKQEQMEKQLNESTLHRLTAGQNGSSGREEAAKGRLISQVQAYRNLTDVPQTRDLQVGGGRCVCVWASVCVCLLGRCWGGAV